MGVGDGEEPPGLRGHRCRSSAAKWSPCRLAAAWTGSCRRRSARSRPAVRPRLWPRLVVKLRDEGSTRSIPSSTQGRMSMGKRRPRGRSGRCGSPAANLPRSAGNPFYERLNRVLDEAGFDAFAEEQCAKFYADGVGRPSLAPDRYFRMLLLGYFEELDSERPLAACSAFHGRHFAGSPDHPAGASRAVPAVRHASGGWHPHQRRFVLPM